MSKYKNISLYLLVFCSLLSFSSVESFEKGCEHHNHITNNLMFGDENLNNLQFLEEIDSLQSVNYYTYPYFYFSRLTNIGNNTHGSCGYVAMAMLLTYFDTFYDDNIVPENYDVVATTNVSSPTIDSFSSSPGSLFETNSGIGNQTSTQYHNYLVYLFDNNYYDSSLHAKLLLDNFSLGFPTTLGVNEYTFEEVLDAYFYSVNYSSYSYIRSPVGATSSEVKDWVVDQIVNYNRPVILGTPGHVTVAYDYNQSTDTVYVHNGYPNSRHIAFSGTFSDAHTLVFSSSHAHSNNYKRGNVSYCPCNFVYHEHLFSHVYLNDTYHERICTCGLVFEEEHTLRIMQLKPNRIYGCSLCGHLFL